MAPENNPFNLTEATPDPEPQRGLRSPETRAKIARATKGALKVGGGLAIVGGSIWAAKEPIKNGATWLSDRLAKDGQDAATATATEDEVAAMQISPSATSTPSPTNSATLNAGFSGQVETEEASPTEESTDTPEPYDPYVTMPGVKVLSEFNDNNFYSDDVKPNVLGAPDLALDSIFGSGDTSGDSFKTSVIGNGFVDSDQFISDYKKEPSLGHTEADKENYNTTEYIIQNATDITPEDLVNRNQETGLVTFGTKAPAHDKGAAIYFDAVVLTYLNDPTMFWNHNEGRLMSMQEIRDSQDASITGAIASNMREIVSETVEEFGDYSENELQRIKDGTDATSWLPDWAKTPDGQKVCIDYRPLDASSREDQSQSVTEMEYLSEGGNVLGEMDSDDPHNSVMLLGTFDPEAGEEDVDSFNLRAMDENPGALNVFQERPCGEGEETPVPTEKATEKPTEIVVSLTMTPENTPENTPTPESTPTPTAENTPTPSQSVTPDNTPSPTKTLTPSPTKTSTPKPPTATPKPPTATENPTSTVQEPPTASPTAGATQPGTPTQPATPIPTPNTQPAPTHTPLPNPTSTPFGGNPSGEQTGFFSWLLGLFGIGK